MKSKRALYKPVTSNENENKGEKRKPLAQGRLVTSHLGSQSIAGPPGQSSHVGVEHYRDHIRQELSHPLRDDPAISPRRETPQISFHDSPRVVKPSQSLDVSDVDSEMNFSGGGEPSSRNVLMVTAQCSGTETSTEVPLQVTVTHSPVRVKSHSPGAIYSDLRESGDVDDAAQVPVDTLHKVQIGCEEDSSLHRTESHPPTANVKAKITASLFNDDEGFLKDGFSSWSQEESQSDQHSVDMNDQSKDVNKENISSSSITDVPGAKPKRKKASFTVPSRYMSHFDSATTKAPMKPMDRNPVIKGTLGPVLTSGRKSSQSQGSTHPILGRKNTSKSDKTHKHPKKSTSSAATDRSYSSRPLSSSQRGTTPDMKSYKGRVRQGTTPEVRIPTADRKSSTPTADNTTLPDAVDISAIGPPPTHKLQQSHGLASPSLEGSSYDVQSPQSAKKKLGYLPTPHSSHHSKHNKKSNSSRVGNSSSRSMSTTQASGLSSSQNMSSKTQQRQGKSHITQTQLDLAYYRMLQAVYLEARLKFAVTKQEKHFMEQMHGIRELNVNLREKKSSMEFQLAQLRHRNALDQALATQESGLSAVCDSLPEFRLQYHTLAQSLDTTRHQIPTTDILIPDSEDDFQVELEQCLSESEQLLAELQLTCTERSPGVTSCSQSLDAMATDFQTELTELARCGELLAAAAVLSDKEASLQTMQLLTQNNCVTE